MIKFKLDKVLVGFAVIYVAFILSNINNPHHADESTHSFVAIFLNDLTRAFVNNPTLSFDKIYDYAVSYLTYYPKISLHYPPLPQMLFSISYSILGISLQAGRLVTALLSLALIFLIYYFSYSLFKSREIALISAFLLMTAPVVINMSILAMQEIPFIFFFTLTMLWLYMTKDKKPETKNFLILSVLIAVTVLTKWQAITILPVIFVYGLAFEGKIFKYILFSLIIAAVILAPYYLVLWKTNLLLLPLTANVPDTYDPPWTQIDGWTYYLSSLLREQFFLPIGTIILLTSLIYFANKGKEWKFFATWILVVYLIMVIVHNKDARYSMNFLPAFVIPASYVIYEFIKKTKGTYILYILLAVIFLQGIFTFVNVPYGFPNVEDIAKYIGEDNEGNVLINTGLGTESPFIFELVRIGKFERQTIRPCVIEFLNESYDNLIKRFDIKYIISDKDESGLTQKQKEFIEYMTTSNNFSLVKYFDRFFISKSSDYKPQEKAEICNYVCATRELVCTKIKNPSDTLK